MNVPRHMGSNPQQKMQTYIVFIVGGVVTTILTGEEMLSLSEHPQKGEHLCKQRSCFVSKSNKFTST